MSIITHFGKLKDVQRFFYLSFENSLLGITSLTQ